MINLMLIRLWFFSLCLLLASCGKADSRNVAFFKDTRAYELAKAVEQGNLGEIERLVKEDSTLLKVTNPTSGSNVLALCLYVEQFESFKKLLELGADPNFIDPFTKYSILMEACSYYGSSLEWIEDSRYVELLLQYGADPTYAVEDGFTNEKGHYVLANSPLMKASSMYLGLVKTLISYSADPYRKLGREQLTPFAEAIESGKFDIMYYYIDTLNVDVHQPMSVVEREPENLKVTYFIQDYINVFMGYIEGSEGYKKKQTLIKHLEGMGVDFENYEYKLK